MKNKMLKKIVAGALSCWLMALPVQAAADTPSAALSPEIQAFSAALDTLSDREKGLLRQQLVAETKSVLQAQLLQKSYSRQLLDDIDFLSEGNDLVYVLKFKPHYAARLADIAEQSPTYFGTVACGLKHSQTRWTMLNKMGVYNFVFRLQADGKQQEKRFPIKDLLAKCSSR